MLNLDAQTEFFTPTECADILQEVLDNDFQYYRYPNLYTLGKSWYRFFAETKWNMSTLAETQQKYLSALNYLGPGQCLLIERLNELFPKFVWQYVANLAPAGYRVICTSQARPWHHDLEKQTMPYSAEFLDFTNWLDYFDEHLSITVMISRGNFTFDYYPQTHGSYKDPVLYTWDDQHGIRDIQYTTLNYNVGDCVIQQGRFLHRPGPSTFEDSVRVTLQANAAIKANVAYLFW